MRSGQTVQSQEQATRTTIDRFNEAFNRHDAEGLAAFLTEDTVFEDTSPAPDGRRIEGKAAVVEFWRGWFVQPGCTVRDRGSDRQRKSGHSALGLPQDAQR
jgi:ketosteroid isomerase-like protein